MAGAGAGAAVVAVIGVVSGLIGIFDFAEEKLAPPEASGSVLRVAVGLDVAGLSNAGGDLPDVRLFNEGGEFLGISADPGHVDDGNVGQIKVDHNNDSR